MNKKLILTLILCLFSQGLQSKEPFYKSDSKMAGTTGLLFGTLLGIKYVADIWDPGARIVSYNPPAISTRTKSGTFNFIDPVKNYGEVQSRMLAGRVNNALPGVVILGAGLACAWYVGKVIKNKIWPK